MTPCVSDDIQIASPIIWVLYYRRASMGTSSAKALPSPSWPMASPRREEDLLQEEEEAGRDARRQAREHG